MAITPDAQATLLLTSHFSKARKENARPLSAREWARLVKWLKEKELTPAQLMTGRLEQRLEGWADKDISRQRIDALLQRSAALGFEMEKWESSSLWVMTRSDEDYPNRLREKLAAESPPVLFGCGNRKLLAEECPKVAVVGSRKTTGENISYSRSVGKLAAENGWCVVSGGASGVDEAAMLGALEAEGLVVGVLANGLLQVALSSKYRSHLMSNNLALVSPFYPEAGFDRGNAMSRNKYVYGLSTVAVVVHSKTEGGTWNGAIENLKRGWSPLWVRKDDEAMGNRAIAAQKGAEWIDSLEQLNDLLACNETEDGLYDLFLRKIRAFCRNSPKSLDDLQDLLKSDRVRKPQLETWLRMAAKEDKIAITDDPVRYQWIANEQLPLAENLAASNDGFQPGPLSNVEQPQLSGTNSSRV